MKIKTSPIESGEGVILYSVAYILSVTKHPILTIDATNFTTANSASLALLLQTLGSAAGEAALRFQPGPQRNGLTQDLFSSYICPCWWKLVRSSVLGSEWIN